MAGGRPMMLPSAGGSTGMPFLMQSMMHHPQQPQLQQPFQSPLRHALHHPQSMHSPIQQQMQAFLQPPPRSNPRNSSSPSNDMMDLINTSPHTDSVLGGDSGEDK
jgi:molybdopterin-biosynthesis enzyme MoeA-like protein